MEVHRVVAQELLVEEGHALDLDPACLEHIVLLPGVLEVRATELTNFVEEGLHLRVVHVEVDSDELLSGAAGTLLVDPPVSVLLHAAEAGLL